MKNTIRFLTFFTLITGPLFTACVSNKKLQALKNRTEQLKKDSIATHHKLALIEGKKSTIAHKSPPPVINNKNNAAVFIPGAVSAIFKSNYPLATEVVWTKEIPLLKYENETTRDYKAFFIIQENKNSVIYSENGELIETKVQILPEQLPQNVYEAIKNKYPEVYIISATTFKNTKINGSYTAIIRTKLNSDETEVVLMENGTFVE